MQTVSNRHWSCRLLQRPLHSTCSQQAWQPNHWVSSPFNLSPPKALSMFEAGGPSVLVNRVCPGRQTQTRISQLYVVLLGAQGPGKFSRKIPHPMFFFLCPCATLAQGKLNFKTILILIKPKTVLLENKDLHCFGF